MVFGCSWDACVLAFDSPSSCAAFSDGIERVVTTWVMLMEKNFSSR